MSSTHNEMTKQELEAYIRGIETRKIRNGDPPTDFKLPSEAFGDYEKFFWQGYADVPTIDRFHEWLKEYKKLNGGI